MNDLNTLALLGVIAGPVIFAAAIYFTKHTKLRNILVLAAALLTSSLGIFIAASPSADIYPGNWALYAGAGLEIAMTLAVLAIAYNIRSWAVGLFGTIQLVLVVISEFMHNESSLGPAFVVDDLSRIMVAIVSVVGSLILVYSIGYMKEHEHHAPAAARSTNTFMFFLVGFIGAMNGLVLANDMKWLGCFFEATTICSFVLIGHDRTREATKNAARAILINSFGGVALTIGAFLALLKGSTQYSGILYHADIIAFAFIALAGLVKSAQMPFQSWLLGAMVAPTPVSALLHSATMVNIGVYLVLRAAPAFAGTKLMYFIAIIGAFSFAATSALAIAQSNGKKVLAYSTIGNLGLIFTCAGIDSPLGYSAAIMLLCFHAVSKGLLFLCMGTIEQKIGSRDIEDMGSLLREMPLTTVITLIGMASMLVPPFGMLLSKWLAIEAAISSPIVLLLVVIGSALTVLFWAKWIGRITTVSYHPWYTIERISITKQSVLAILAAIVVIAGLGAILLYRDLFVDIAIRAYQGTYISQSDLKLFEAAGKIPYWPFMAFIGLALVAGILAYFTVNASNVRSPFLCGENVPGSTKTYEFRSAKDSSQLAWSSSLYLRHIFEESKTTMWANLIAAVIILSMFAAIGVL